MPPTLDATFAGLSSRAWPVLEEGGALTRQLGLILGVGLLVLVATLGSLLALVLRAPADGERRAGPDGVAVEGTLTILPGRFLVEEGEVDIELRLVKTGSTDREETTIGREPGPLYRHVRFLAPSVSAKHAKLVCDRGRYTIVNYSRTNPTRVNGEPLAENASRRLVEGDRIEIGEVAMTYRENR